jgi:hypothetical protein
VTSTLVTDEIEDYHVTRLREFCYDERYVDPRDIVLRDRDELIMAMLVDLRHWPSILNGGALMNLLTLGSRGRILHGLQKLIPQSFGRSTLSLRWVVVGVDRMWRLMKGRKW